MFVATLSLFCNATTLRAVIQVQEMMEVCGFSKNYKDGFFPLNQSGFQAISLKLGVGEGFGYVRAPKLRR
jgi:hypothetical protein